MKWKHLLAAGVLGASTAMSGAAFAQGKTITIGVSVPAADHGWTGGIDYFAQQAVARLQKTYPNLKFVLATAGDPGKQASDLEDMVATRNIDALVILPTESDPLTGPIKRVKDAGKFVTVVDRKLSQEGIEDLYVAGDNPNFGRVAGEYFKSKLPNGGNIVILRGMPLPIDNERVDAFQDAIKGTNVKVLGIQYANWNRDDGFKVMQDFLSRFPKIDAVWAQDDDTALGAIEAIRQAKRDKDMWIVGGAGMKQMIKRVMDKDTLVPADVAYDPGMIATAIELTALKFEAGIPVQGRFILRSPLITPENAQVFYHPDSPF
ncbi:monosaccharide ABC transporter substrate-binding protein, CUT2 family [Faunimonas pinastri]|uniref:Monosaccharide ABC transporter substrate-binding protein, CUT2 family n=1 Tax=Faunimonas pinastri TaxID=1855383 RepID=A0A1H9KWQ3_9HYPH|nr:ABC transporter substrate-binding protein [Faunimonas pinastri]SER03590.1 monosaccharide ABC transporter substrate-binding protein, CUT2 family [Faunimonas pinastri]